MITSTIIIPKAEDKPSKADETRLTTAYRMERSQQEVVEIELSRAKIVVMDEHGNLKRIPIIPEH